MKEKVAALVDEALEKKPSLFLIGLEIGPNNQIRVVIDGDQEVSVNDCIALSKEIEANLDRDEEDFSLEVTSAGAQQPLQLVRQYKKNIGRKLHVKTNEKKYDAELTGADDDKITLEWKTREPKPVGKGKTTVKKKAVVNYAEILEATIKLTF